MVDFAPKWAREAAEMGLRLQILNLRLLYAIAHEEDDEQLHKLEGEIDSAQAALELVFGEWRT